MNPFLRVALSSILFFSISFFVPSHPEKSAPTSPTSASASPFNGWAWKTETVDSNGGHYSQLALDGNDSPLIAYQGDDPISQNNLNIARWNGTDWIKDIVDHAGDTGWLVPSLELDPSGNPHMGYLVCTWYSCSLRYSHWTGSAWQNEDVPMDPDNVGISGASLTLDSDGLPRFAYCTQERVTMKTELIYARWTGTAWSSERVGDDGCWSSTSIKLDSLDRPGISFYDQEAIDLKYAHWTGMAWSVDQVDGSSYAGMRNSLEINLVDQPSIAYYSFFDGKLKYAKWNNTDWVINNVDNLGGQVNFMDISLALDVKGYPHIAYIDEAMGKLKYAALFSGEWQIDVVDDGTLSASLRMDSTGLPHISYFNPSLGLKYAQPILQPYIHYIPFLMVNP